MRYHRCDVIVCDDGLQHLALARDLEIAVIDGERRFGNFSFERKDLIAQIYFLHYALVLPELTGALVMGIVALIWACDCFVGLYLTLPAGGRGAQLPRRAPSATARLPPRRLQPRAE